MLSGTQASLTPEQLALGKARQEMGELFWNALSRSCDYKIIEKNGPAFEAGPLHAPCLGGFLGTGTAMKRATKIRIAHRRKLAFGPRSRSTLLMES